MKFLDDKRRRERNGESLLYTSYGERNGESLLYTSYGVVLFNFLYLF